MKENFDDIIRRRWEEQQFPVDEQHRQDMARMLEGEKKRRGFIFWWFGGAAVILLLAIGLWIFGMNNAENKPRTSQRSEDPAIVSDAAGENTEDTEMANAEKPVLRPAQTHPTATAQQPAEAETKVEAKAKAEIVAKANIKAEAKSKKTNRSTNSKSSQHNSNAKIGKKENQNNKTGAAITLAKKKGQPELANNESVQPKDNVPEGGYKVELENPNQVSILSKEVAIKVFPDSIEYDPWTNAIYRDGTVRSLNMTKPVEALSIQEVESLKRNEPGLITPHTKMTHPVYFLAETGLGMVLASKPFYDGGIKFNIGGGLGYKLIPRVHLQLTGGYLMQDGGFHFERTSAVNTLSFGVRSQFNSLSPDRLHFVYTKIGIAYRFQRSTLDIHTGVQWLYGAQGNITTHEQSQLPPYNPTTSKYAWLNTEGLRKTQWWSDVSYGYMVFPKLYLHGGIAFYYTSVAESNLPHDGYDWNGKTAAVQPFITLNYLLHANF